MLGRRKVRILKANTDSIVLEVAVSAYYRIEIPKSIRDLLEPGETVQVTIKKVEPK